MIQPNRYLTIAIILAVFAEIGVALVLCNARPDPPPGFRLWFGGIGVFAILVPVWLYWKERKARQNR